MSKKLGRNDPCWCGSGVKYKKCHLNRRDESPMVLSDIIKDHEKILFASKMCLHPDASSTNCDGSIIKAHTIQRNGGLSRIARAGHVYHFKPDFMTLIKTGGRFEAKKIGVKDASTFTGFCGKHDDATFAPIEKDAFAFTPEQCFLLGYRAVSMELYKKLGKVEMGDLLRKMDAGKEQITQVAVQRHAELFEEGSESGLKDTQATKSVYDAALQKADYSLVDYYAIEVDKCPELLCSGVMTPDTDFSGKTIQDLTDTSKTAEQLAFSIIPTDTGGAVVFSWAHNKGGAIDALVRSLHAMSNEDLVHSVVRFAFLMLENVYMSPDWWDGLKTDDQNLIAQMVMNFDPTDIADNGLRVVSWKVLQRISTIDLT